MMNSAVTKAAVLAVLTGASMLSAAQPRQEFRSVDARTLDVAGVKTGMDFEEAMSAAMRHFQVPRSQLKPETSPGEGLVTHARLPRYFTYEKSGVKLIVHFEDRVPVDKARPLAAAIVIYELPWSQENAKAMGEAALAKYGPNSNAPYDLPREWCAQPNRAQMGTCKGGSNQAILQLSQVKLELSDPAWQQARIDFVNSTQSRKPSF